MHRTHPRPCSRSGRGLGLCPRDAGLVSRNVLGSERLERCEFVTDVVGSFSAIWIPWEQDKVSSLLALYHLAWAVFLFLLLAFARGTEHVSSVSTVARL